MKLWEAMTGMFYDPSGVEAAAAKARAAETETYSVVNWIADGVEHTEITVPEAKQLLKHFNLQADERLMGLFDYWLHLAEKSTES